MVLYQPINGYCYNSDTHFLFYFIKENLKKFKNISGNALDIGSGSGILGLLVKRDYPKLEMYSLEPQEIFQFLTKKNSETNKIKTTVLNGKLQDVENEMKYDIVVSNPPFYPSSVVQSQNENIKIARYNDNLPLEQFISKVSRILNKNGKFFFCYDVKCTFDIIHYLKKNNLNVESMQYLHPKKDKKASLILIYARKNSKSLVDILPPIIMFKNKVISDEVNNIYKMCNTYSLKVEI
jgi:tRNA1(Val) A37 N6-methylase TrmN6